MTTDIPPLALPRFSDSDVSNTAEASRDFCDAAQHLASAAEALEVATRCKQVTVAYWAEQMHQAVQALAELASKADAELDRVRSRAR